MSLYYEAAAVLANSAQAGGSLKSRIYKQKDLKSSPAQLFALVTEASKWSVVLKNVIENCGLLAEEKKLTPILALLLTHDVVLSKNGVAAPANHVLKLAINRHKARLAAEFTKARIRSGHATLEAFKHFVNNGGLSVEDEASQNVIRHPRWVRVNTLKTTLEEQLSTTFAEYERTEHLSQILSEPGPPNVYFVDPNIPNLLALPSKVDLSKCAAYIGGQIIFQDKASCFPALLLDATPEDGDVIDGCAAPGNKTTHLAALISERRTEQCREQNVIAFERDKARASTLMKMVKLASADQAVLIKAGYDFLAAKPDSQEYRNVGAILLDPSCSGSGIVGRDDVLKIHLPELQSAEQTKPSKGKKRKREHKKDTTSEPSTTLDLELGDSTPEETPIDDKLSERLTALSTFQLRILTHAMQFTNAHKITYSTCSIHFQENEGVVFQALASPVAQERGWKVLKREHQVEGLKIWKRRGVWEDDKLGNEVDVNDEQKEDVLNSSIRCEKGTEDGTMGFFVAAFARDESAARNGPDSRHYVETQAARKDEEEEWNGFSEDEDTKRATSKAEKKERAEAETRTTKKRQRHSK